MLNLAKTKHFLYSDVELIQFLALQQNSGVNLISQSGHVGSCFECPLKTDFEFF